MNQSIVLVGSSSHMAVHLQPTIDLWTKRHVYGW